jgi:purine-nucleoside phosphorylase
MREDSVGAAAILRDRLGAIQIDVGLIHGGSLGGIADLVASPIVVPYRDLPGFCDEWAPGNAGQCILGTLGTARLAIFQGRPRYHERGDIQSARPVLETLKLLGAGAVVLTGSAGSLKKELAPGAFIAVRDHINLTGINPLVGNADEGRCIDLTQAYDPHLRELFALGASESGRRSNEGTLMWFPGPNYETPAEINAARVLGADLVGMSIVPEALIARALGLRVLAITVVTNYAAGLNPEPLGPAQIQRVSSASAAAMTRVLSRLFERWIREIRR